MTTTNNESPVAIHGHTMYIGLPSKALSLDAQELRAEMKRATKDSLDTVEEIRFTGDVAITGPADGLFAHMPRMRKIVNLSQLDVSEVTSMKGMFEGDLSLESPGLINGMPRWDMSHVENMDTMFKDCQSLEYFDLRSSTSFDALKSAREMFFGCSSLEDVDMCLKKTPNLEDVSSMFMGCKNLDTIYLQEPDTSHITSTSRMFLGCENLRNLTLDGFDASKVTDATEMFRGCTNLIRISAHDSQWPDPNDVASNNMFHGCDMLSDIGRAQSLVPLMEENGLTQDVIDARRATASMLARREGEVLVLGDPAHPMQTDGLNLRHEIERLCQEYEQPNKIKIVGDIQISGEASYLFSPAYYVKLIEGMNHLDTSHVTSMEGMFYGMDVLESVDVSSFDTSHVTDMSFMFSKCERLEEVDVSHFDTRNVTNLEYMFERCSALHSLDLSSFDVSNVTSAASLCHGSPSLESASIAGWHAPNLVDARELFSGCAQLTELDTTDFSTSRVANTYRMFDYCQSLKELDLRGLSGTSTDVSEMFCECSSLRTLDIRNLEVDSSKPSHDTFAGCDSLNDMHITESMAREAEYQKTELNNIITIGADQLCAAEDGRQAIALTLSDGCGVRRRTLLAYDEWVHDNGNGTFDVELPTLVSISGSENGLMTSELTSARTIHYQSDVARKMQAGKAKEPIRLPVPIVFGDNFNYDEEIPF